MDAYNIIDKKKNAIELTYDEIKYMVDGFLEGEVEDYQFSAFLMAIYFQDMTDKELEYLTIIMRDSGEVLNNDYMGQLTVDKHSTGGVGDKTSLIVLAIAGSAGVKIGKMSGRGLGHTGGTIDKLESIPGFQTDLDKERIEGIANDVGVFIIGQTKDLAPADKEIYALRDMTATVDSIPLIASSIMSKKLASGSDALVLDVKLGSGAFMKDLESASELGQRMMKIGKSQGMDTRVIISNMDHPLGRAVGNRLEIREVIETLEGRGPKDLTEVSLELSAQMIHLGLAKSIEESREIAREELETLRALDKFYEIIRAQGGDLLALEDLDEFTKAEYMQDMVYEKDGYINKIDAELIGLAAKDLGAGRNKLGASIDFQAGIYLHKKLGDKVNKGDKVFSLYTSDKTKLAKAIETSIGAFEIEDKRVEGKDPILKIID